VRRWMVWLLGLYSDAYASNQYRVLQQFFKWLGEEEELPDPMARVHPPAVTEKLVPVFTSEELLKLEKACQGRSFAQRRDAAIIAVFQATGIRAAELAGIRYDARDPQASDAGVAALVVAGVNNRGPLTSNGIYQMVARRGRQCGVVVHPHRFRHHFSHPGSTAAVQKVT